MKIMVTGGAGFVGANLCERLLREGHSVVCVDNFYCSDRDNVDGLENLGNFVVVERDIVEGFEGVEALDGCDFDAIYHLASPASPRWYQKDPIYTLRTNFEGTRNVLEFARKCGESGIGADIAKMPRVLFSSTSEVYGDPAVHPQEESYRGDVNPHGIRSCYDEGKRVAESLCMNYWREYGVPVKIVRIFNTYGPKMAADDGRVVSNFIVQALHGENLTIYGDGSQTRSFQYIDDLLDGMVAFMELDDRDFPGPVNLGNPDEFTVIELAEKVVDIVGGGNRGGKIEFEALPEDDPKKRRPDISLAKEKLRWAPRIKLDEGLKNTVEYFSSAIESQPVS